MRKLKLISVLLLSLVASGCFSQSFILEENASITLGSDASFFMGGDATLNGTFTNEGTVISFSDAVLNGSFTNNGTITSHGDLDLQDNTTMNSISFVGSEDQTLSANDTIVVQVLTMDKPVNSDGIASELNIDSIQVQVETTLAVTSGVLGAGADTTLLATGEITSGSSEEGTGFIEGKLVSFTTEETVRFPLGINGFYNAIELNNLPLNTRIVVESNEPETERLLPTEDMIGIAPEVEWIITAPNDSIEVGVKTFFSGLQLGYDNLSQSGNVIRAQGYLPTIVKLSTSDTVYQDLGGGELVNLMTQSDVLESDSITSDQTFYISSTPTYVSIALIPVLTEPEFFIPTAFSPNSSNLENRVFRPYFAGAEITSINLQIWDSFQNKLYSYSQTDQDIDLSEIGWDGFLQNGQIADEGVYYFTVDLEAGEELYRDFGSFLLMN